MTANDDRLVLTKQMIDNVVRIAALIPLADVQAVADEIARTDTLMPLLHPTEYMRIADNIPAHREMVKAFVEFRAKLESLRDRYGLQT